MTEKDRLEIQHTWCATNWWNLGESDSKLQESSICNPGPTKRRRRATQQYNVSCRWSNFQRKTLDRSKWRHWRFDTSYTKSLPVRTTESECTIYAIQWTLPLLEESFQNGSIRCWHDLEKMDSQIHSTMEPGIKMAKGTCAEPKRRRTGVASKWLCETLWVQIQTNHWNIHWQRRCFSIGRNGT